MSQASMNNKVVRPMPQPVVEAPKVEEPPKAPESDIAQELAQLRADFEAMKVRAGKSQQFFDELIAERNKPHCGQQWRDMVDGLSKRARAYGLWEPHE